VTFCHARKSQISASSQFASLDMLRFIIGVFQGVHPTVLPSPYPRTTCLPLQRTATNAHSMPTLARHRLLTANGQPRTLPQLFELKVRPRSTSIFGGDGSLRRTTGEAGAGPVGIGQPPHPTIAHCPRPDSASSFPNVTCLNIICSVPCTHPLLCLVVRAGEINLNLKKSPVTHRHPSKCTIQM
jgi:hypothetical protein